MSLYARADDQALEQQNEVVVALEAETQALEQHDKVLVPLDCELQLHPLGETVEDFAVAASATPASFAGGSTSRDVLDVVAALLGQVLEVVAVLLEQVLEVTLQQVAVLQALQVQQVELLQALKVQQVEVLDVPPLRTLYCYS